MPVMVCRPECNEAGRLTVTVLVDPDPDPELGARKLKLWDPVRVSVSVAAEITLLSIVAPVT